MTAADLILRFGTWGEYPEFPVADWQYEVENGDTRLGYWEWVEDRIAMANEEATEGTPEPSPEDWVCPECGSDEIHATAWVDLRTGIPTNDEGPLSSYWCCQCEDHFERLTQRKDWTPKEGTP